MSHASFRTYDATVATVAFVALWSLDAVITWSSRRPLWTLGPEKPRLTPGPLLWETLAFSAAVSSSAGAAVLLPTRERSRDEDGADEAQKQQPQVIQSSGVLVLHGSFYAHRKLWSHAADSDNFYSMTDPSRA